MKILLINLDQSVERFKEQLTQFERLTLSFERFSATSIQDFTAQDYQKMAFGGQRPMKQSELACFLSHKRVWEYVVQSNQPCAILEDDAVLVSDFKDVLDHIENIADLDYVNLEVVGRKKIVEKTPSYHFDDYQLYKLYQDRNGTGGYVLFPTGAKQLLDFMNDRSIGLVDEYIASCRTLRSFQIEPAALLQGVICPMYGVETEIDKNSVIGLVKNVHQFDLSIKQKLQFKKNRIVAQIMLGLIQIKYLFIGRRRDIGVNASKFK
jgi:glycosyl transferase family 25